MAAISECIAQEAPAMYGREPIAMRAVALLHDPNGPISVQALCERVRSHIDDAAAANL